VDQFPLGGTERVQRFFLTCDLGEDWDLADRDVEYALSGIGINEYGDKGQDVLLYGREMGVGEDTGFFVAWDTLHAHDVPNNLPQNVAAFGTNRYVRAVRACNNNNNDHRLKGLEIKSAYIDDEVYISESVTDSYDQPNCDDWDSYVTHR
jgi:hypothetical protein